MADPILNAARSPSLSKPRFLGPGLLGLVVVASLYWLLYTLISVGHRPAGRLETLPTIDFVRLKKSFEVETRERKAPPKLPEKEKAPEVPTQHMQVDGPQQMAVNIGPIKVDKEVAKNTDFGLSASDGEYLPIIKIAPLYPESAMSRGIEGYVFLEFTVTETGATADVQVIDAQPKGVFDDAARAAVLKFKYKPRVENGRPIRVEHVRHVITFKLENKAS